MILTQARVRELLDYDQATGVLTRREGWRGTARSGSRAGAVNVQGYRQIYVDGQLYREHRLIWLWMTGRWPARQIDHRNCVRDDNRWSNLREATVSQNGANAGKRRDNKSGFKGVCKHPQGRWMASIKVTGRSKHLGLFDAAEAAHAAYVAAAERLYGEFARG